MIKLKYIVLFLLINQFQPLFAQNTISTDSLSAWTVFKSDFGTGIDDGIKFVSLSFNADSKDLLTATAIAGVTASFFLLDKSVRETALKNHNAFMDDFTKIGSYYGNGVFPLALSAALYSTGLMTNESEIRNTGRILFESLAASGLAVQIIKVVSGRSRPYKLNGNTFFKPFNFDNDFNSFPSGHTIVAFTTSTVLAGKIKNVYASIGLYSLAFLTAYQRIYSDNHWFSDTFLGAALGYGIGRLFLSFEENNENGAKQNLRFSFSPGISGYNPSLNITVNF